MVEENKITLENEFQGLDCRELYFAKVKSFKYLDKMISESKRG